MRKFSGKAKWAIWTLAVVFTVFQIYTAASIPLPDFAQRSVHLAFGFILIFLLYPPAKGATGRGFLVLDIVLCLAVIALAARHVITANILITGMQIASPATYDVVFGVILFLTALEVGRRTIGGILVTVTVIFVLYSLLGPYIPGALGHQGIALRDLITYNYLTEVGIMGTPMNLSSGIIFAVVAFGAFMLSLGGGEMIIKLANALAGRYRGGPAKVAVIGSALFGTVSGSSVANVVGTGMYTIPMMKKLGYQSVFAGAVEACASTGGQIMPPVMGVAAFVMTDFLQIPYGKLIWYALIPALFYFITIFFQVDFRAAVLRLKGAPRGEVLRLRDIPKAEWIGLLPILVFIYFVAVAMFSVTRAAFYATISVWVCFIVRELLMQRRVHLKTLKQLLMSFEAPARQMLTIVGALACIGIIMFTVEVSGLGTKLSMLLIRAAGQNLMLMLFMTMIASLVLGMGLPTIVCYILLAVLAAPSLVQLGVLPLAAHMFVFYFGIISSITPPVAIAAYVAAAIAQGDAMKTGFQATRLGIAGFIVPYVFVLSPSLLMQGPPTEIVRDCVSLLVATYSLAAAVEGYMLMKLSIPMRIASLAAAVLLIFPALVPTIAGFILLILLIVIQRLSLKRERLRGETRAESL